MPQGRRRSPQTGARRSSETRLDQDRFQQLMWLPKRVAAKGRHLAATGPKVGLQVALQNRR